MTLNANLLRGTLELLVLLSLRSRSLHGYGILASEACRAYAGEVLRALEEGAEGSA